MTAGHAAPNGRHGDSTHMLMRTTDLTNRFRTVALLAALAGLLIAIGGIAGGTGGMILALAFATLMNVGILWFGDRIALRANGARRLEPGELPVVEHHVRDLAARAGMPMPALWVVDRPEPNAFATGRSPSHASIAVTTGIVRAMDERQLRGVLAHEVSHIVNRDLLVGTVAATIGGAIGFLGDMALWSMIFGGGDEESGPPAGVLLVGAILAPMAAMLIQLAVSRSREYGADRTGAQLTGDPAGLASALETLEAETARLRGPSILGRRAPQPAPVPAAMAHLYTVSPLAGGMGSLFSTHPPIADRVRRLREMAGRGPAIGG